MEITHILCFHIPSSLGTKGDSARSKWTWASAVPPRGSLCLPAHLTLADWCPWSEVGQQSDPAGNAVSVMEGIFWTAQFHLLQGCS